MSHLRRELKAVRAQADLLRRILLQEMTISYAVREYMFGRLALFDMEFYTIRGEDGRRQRIYKLKEESVPEAHVPLLCANEEHLYNDDHVWQYSHPDLDTCSG